jgi:hypothetical protein
LIEARKIDGGEQFFSRANDFGFSKNQKHCQSGIKKSAFDVVWAIRKFQPDVIINRAIIVLPELRMATILLQHY